MTSDVPRQPGCQVRFRRGLVALSVVACVLTAIAMGEAAYTAAGPPGSFEFGALFYLRIGGLVLTPVLLAWITTRCSKSRPAGVTSLVLVSLACLLGAGAAAFALTLFRPPFSAERYDQAVREVASGIRSLTNLSDEQRDRLRSLKPRVEAARADREVLAAVMEDCDSEIASLERDIQQANDWPATVLDTFRRHGVSDGRAEEFIRQMGPALDFERLMAADRKLVEIIRSTRNQAIEALRAAP